MVLPLSRSPQPDKAEFNAFFPSKLALGQFTNSRSELEGAYYARPDRAPGAHTRDRD